MPKPATTKQAMADILKDGPLHAKTITERLLKSGKTSIGGKNAQGTVASMLFMYAKKGDTFVKTGPNMYGLLGAKAAAKKPAPRPSKATLAKESEQKAQRQAKPDPKPSRKPATKPSARKR